MRPTLADVASRAGVSMMTVSNVLAGKSNKVSVATAQRVREAIDETGYVVNASARSLSGNRSRIIAIAISGEGNILEGAHNSSLVGDITQELQRRNYHTMLIPARDVTETISSLRSWNVDGAIFLNTIADDIATIREQHSVPMVFSDNYADQPGILTVRTDDYEGGRLAARHLIEAGHRHAMFLGPIRHRVGVVDERLRGFREVHAEAGLPEPVAPEIISDTSLASGLRVADIIADLPALPTAIFCSADDLGVGLIRGLIARGVRVPEDVSIVGFDGFIIGEACTPPLTTIAQDVHAKAVKAVDLLVAAIDGELPPNAPIEALPVTLLARESVATLGAEVSG
ncbi:MAG: LacI family DNA-binding transcriptional regulator [Dermabacter sp.]|nr:LacI family DNA-binding transcriptional regulator [Dermabacter sp.]